MWADLRWAGGSRRLFRLVFCAVCGLFCVGVPLGCREFRRVKPPKIKADAAGRDAISRYDLDGDSLLSLQELKQVPGIDATKFDSDRNGTVSSDEIAARVRKWQESGLGLISCLCVVKLDGKPLSGATVNYLPEEFLGQTIQPGSGTTNIHGSAEVGIAKDDLRSDLQRFKVMHCGIFKVTITHPDHAIPARYNSETTLGHEVCLESPGAPYPSKVFDLKNR